jgi:apolipoprotein N-acyltransferase
MEVALPEVVVGSGISGEGKSTRVAPAIGGIASGLLLGVAALPWDLGFLAAVGVAPLLAVLVARTTLREAWMAGFLCGVGWFGIGFAWMPVVAGANWRTWLLFVAFVPVASLSCVAFALAAASLRRLGVAAQLAAAPLLWVWTEDHQAIWLDGGLPWLRLGHGLGAWPVAMQPAALGGVALLSAWLVAANVVCVPGTWIGAHARRCLAVALLVPLLIGGVRSARVDATEALRVGAVQPGVPQHEKFDAAHFDAHLRRLLVLSEGAVRNGADLVVWPESAYERLLDPSAFDPFLAAAVRDLGVPVVAGVRRREAAASGSPSERNAAVVLDADGVLRGVVDKRYPVPVFEAEPRSAWSLALARRGFWPGRLRAGAAPAPVSLDPGTTVGVAVCFDMADGELVRALRREGARILVTPANEAFSGAWTAVAQARIARLRAVESGVPVVRVSNSGRSEWIDDRGNVVGFLPAGARASGVRAVALATEPTPFARAGGAPCRAALALPFVVVVVTRRARLPGGVGRPGATSFQSIRPEKETP